VAVASVSQGGVDDWDKVPSLDAGEAPRRSTSSLGATPVSPLRYTDASRIRVGHRVIYNNQVGTVVVLIDDGEGSPGFPVADWSCQDTGLVIRFDNGAVLQLNSPDARLVRDKNDTA
jgi:hypothetical protein